MRNASARGFEMKAPFNNNLPMSSNDVIVNPVNPVNPDSKSSASGKFILKPVGEKTRGIASLRKLLFFDFLNIIFGQFSCNLLKTLNKRRIRPEAAFFT